jgi:uncharacterized protein DUF2505
MNRFTLFHEFNCSADQFWHMFLDRQFTERHYLEGVRFSEYRIVQQRDMPGSVARTAEAMPRVQLPNAMAKLFGAGLRYVEEGVFDKSAGTFKYRTIPSALADRIHNEGAIHLETLPGRRVRRVIDVLVDVRIALLGSSMETLAEKTLREGWDASAQFIDTWLASQPSSTTATAG